jgi:hypothetical protein
MDKNTNLNVFLIPGISDTLCNTETPRKGIKYFIEAKRLKISQRL